MIINQDKEAIVSKEADNPAEAVVCAAAWQVVIAGVGALPVGRRR